MARSLPGYVYDYCAEIYLLDDNNVLHQRYITYNQSLQGLSKAFKREDYAKFKLKAWAKVPLSNNETLDFSIYLTKTDEIEDLKVQYRIILDKRTLTHPAMKINLPLQKGYSQSDIHILNIRTDYGHKQKQAIVKHTNIDVFDIFNKKINANEDKSFIKQNFEIHGYHSAINYVLMQAEKVNPLVGAQYWLSQLGTDHNKVEVTHTLWKDSGANIPLSVLSNNIYIKMIERSYNYQRPISESEFQEIAKGEIELAKRAQRDDPDNIVSRELGAPAGLFPFPFPFLIAVEEFRYGSFVYYEDGHIESDNEFEDMTM
jgi:hypothetical protein